MKRFDNEKNSTYILQTPPKKETKKTSFDISKLLQLAKNLNLNSLFGGQNSAQNTTPAQNFTPPQSNINILSEHNRTLAKNSVENHINMVNMLQNKK